MLMATLQSPRYWKAIIFDGVPELPKGQKRRASTSELCR
jgi:hypothetical protein